MDYIYLYLLNFLLLVVIFLSIVVFVVYDYIRRLFFESLGNF